MENHGTPSSCTNGQFATISGRLTIALPRALQLSGLDVKSVLRHTDEGERLSLALAEALKMLYNGNAATVVTSHIIDCDADPYVRDGWKVEEHQKGGQFKFDASQINLYLSAAQKKGSIEGNRLRKELADKPALNANVLDYLLANPHLIPEDWKGKYVFFWGTVYRRRGGDLCVRCLFWNDGGWRWSRGWLGRGWDGFNPAAVRAS